MNDKTVANTLYKSREKIQPRDVHGFFARLRVASVWWLLGMYYLGPWLNWNGRQAILFDLPARKFYIFGLELWPQDFVFLAWLLIIAALTLFYVTTLAGRVWCGYACPQTVWTEVFMMMERWTEGPRNKRIKLDKSPWTREKIIRRGSKHLLWLVFALWTGFTFVGYFTPIRDLGARLVEFQLGPWEMFWIFFYSLATWGNAGFLREQVCLYMCPYARFQSAMFDKDTLIISYDEKRGEPRGARKKGQKPEALGDCVDCKQCVQVCPTGIDIRDGLQYECIACGGCIDVCDAVMDKMGYEKGLIRYTTQHEMNGYKTHILRPRVIVYTVIWVSMILLYLYALANRSPIQMDVIKERNPIYREISGNRIENDYTLKIMNKDHADHVYTVSVEGLPEAEVKTIPKTIRVKSGELRPVAARVMVPRANLKQPEYRFKIHIQATDAPEIQRVEDAQFNTPVNE